MKLLYGEQWKGARSQDRNITGGRGEALSMGATASAVQVNTDTTSSLLFVFGLVLFFFLDSKSAFAPPTPLNIWLLKSLYTS